MAKGKVKQPKNKKKKTELPPLKYIVAIVIAVILGFIIGILITHPHTFFSGKEKMVPETERNSMKVIPQDVKAELKKTEVASISATLHVPILMYHYVEYVQNKKDTLRQRLNVDPDVFEEQIQTLQSAGYTFITAKDLGDILDGTMQAPEKPVILTFDDGHWDLDTNVVPILKKYQVHATAYIVPGFVGTNSDSLTPSELQDVIKSGLVDVGAHTVHHISLKGKPLTTVQYEVDQSKEMLEDTYHIKVYSFAYPYGSFDQQTIDVVKKAGFTTAASTIAGNEQSNQNRYFLFRVRPGYMTGQALLNYLNQVWNSAKTL